MQMREKVGKSQNTVFSTDLWYYGVPGGLCEVKEWPHDRN